MKLKLNTISSENKNTEYEIDLVTIPADQLVTQQHYDMAHLRKNWQCHCQKPFALQPQFGHYHHHCQSHGQIRLTYLSLAVWL